jgi:hypothetical protein
MMKRHVYKTRQEELVRLIFHLTKPEEQARLIV